MSLQIDPAFQVDHGIERYQVLVSPEPDGQCPVRSEERDRYHCPSLDVGTNYSYSVSGSNCGSQMGETGTFFVYPQGIALFI